MSVLFQAMQHLTNLGLTQLNGYDLTNNKANGVGE
jgi:hypothetical protein